MLYMKNVPYFISASVAIEIHLWRGKQKDSEHVGVYET
uniref:Uncharacterized protein n=1 Tax=Anguilla anguilla TaxID=7936 RepID=A0A0E9UN50_ANGAN